MPILVSVDPGKSSGVAVLGFDQSTTWLEAAYQVYPGVGAFRALLDVVQERFPVAEWISEKFSPRSGAGFGQGLDSTLPLVCEGVLIDRDLLPEYQPGEKRWRSPQLQYLAGGVDLRDRKRRQHKFLKDNGYYRTGKDFGTADADDARSAIAHGINYLIREVKHKPSYQLVVDWLEKEGE